MAEKKMRKKKEQKKKFFVEKGNMKKKIINTVWGPPKVVIHKDYDYNKTILRKISITEENLSLIIV